MSMTRITLSAEEKIVKTARKIAKEEHTSISAMFSNFIKAREAQKNRKSKPELGPLTREATGMLKVPENFDFKDSLADALIEKYGTPK